MENKTGMKVAKKYQEAIAVIEKDCDGVWAYTKDGYKFASTDCHTAHEFNQKDAYNQIQSIVPCECEQCQHNEDERDESKVDNHTELLFVTDNDVKLAETVLLERPKLLQDDNVMDADISVWLGNLSAYNSGHSIGRWVNLPQKSEELQRIAVEVNVAAMHETGDFNEETEIFDINVNLSGLYNGLNRLGLPRLNKIAKTLNVMHEYEQDSLPATMEVVDYVKDGVFTLTSTGATVNLPQ